MPSDNTLVLSRAEIARVNPHHHLAAAAAAGFLRDPLGVSEMSVTSSLGVLCLLGRAKPLVSPRLLRIILRNGTHQPIGVGRDLHALGPAAGKPAQPLVDVPFSSSRLARWLLRSARSSLRSVTWPLRDTVSDLPRGAGAWVEGLATAEP